MKVLRLRLSGLLLGSVVGSDLTGSYSSVIQWKMLWHGKAHNFIL